MSAPTLTEVTPYAVVSDAWQVYRRSQQIPMALSGAGDLMMAQNRLFILTAPFASGRVPVMFADLPAIADALDELAALIEWHYGTEIAARVSGDDDGRAA